MASAQLRRQRPAEEGAGSGHSVLPTSAGDLHIDAAAAPRLSVNIYTWTRPVTALLPTPATRRDLAGLTALADKYPCGIRISVG